MTRPHDRITMHPEYARIYQQYIDAGDSPETAAERAYHWTSQLKPNRTPLYVLLSVLGVVVLLGAMVTVAVLMQPRAAPTRSTGQPVTAASPEPEPSPSPASYTPATTDFTITPKITEKECFGDAGCVITFRINVMYTGLPLSDGDEWLVTYQTVGGKDGPQINSFTLRGEEMRYDDSEVVQVPSSKTVLKITATEVALN